MSENLLIASSRATSGKGGARQKRLSGFVPGVYYARGEANVHFAVEAVDLGRMLRKRHTIISLKVDNDEPRPCIIRALQRDPVDWHPLHIDLLGVHTGERITVSVPVKLTGTAIGVKESSGILEHGAAELSVECLPADIPEFIEIDVSNLALGDSIHVRDLNILNVRIIDDVNMTLAHVGAPVIEKAPEVAPVEGAEGAEAAAETKGE